MNKPEIKILSVSNVYCRLMEFKKQGDQEEGHFHDYDHGTLLSQGKLKVEMFDEKDQFISEKVYQGPTFIFIRKDCTHRLTALEDNTIAVCIHALRTIDEDIISPDFFVEQIEFADSKDQVTDTLKGVGSVMQEKGLKYKTLARFKK